MFWLSGRFRFFCIAAVVMLMVGTAMAREGGAEQYLARLVADMNPTNARDKVDQLAARVRDGRVTVDAFADVYFRKSPEKGRRSMQRKRWVRNMTINFRIINHQSRWYNPQKEILARRSVELTLYRLKE